MSVVLSVYFYKRVYEFLVLFVKYATAKICITQETRVPQLFVHSIFGIRYPGLQYPDTEVIDHI